MQDIDIYSEVDIFMDGATDSDYREALMILRDFLKYLRSDTKPYQLLGWWVSKEIERLNEGKVASCYTAENLKQSFGSSSSNPATAWMSQYWKELKIFEEKHSEGLEAFAQRANQEFVCIPRKQQSQGGAGNQSKYYFECRKVRESSVEVPPNAVDSSADEVHYILDTKVQPSWWAKKLFASGYRLMGWKKWLLLGYYLINLLLLAIVAFSVFYAFMYLSYSGLDILKWGLSLSAVAFCFWQSIKPIVELADWRIIMAPAGLYALKEDHVQLELASLPDARFDAKREVRLVRYSAVCPVCAGKIVLRNGGKQFPNRLVGRCMESPAEHVYSFDRMTKKGKLLLSSPQKRD